LRAAAIARADVAGLATRRLFDGVRADAGVVDDGLMFMVFGIRFASDVLMV
jgi:hypothetical protein